MNFLKTFFLALPEEAACATLLHSFFLPGRTLPEGVRGCVQRIAPDELAKRAEAAGMEPFVQPADMVHGYTMSDRGFDFDLVVHDPDRGTFRAYFAIKSQGEVIRKLQRSYGSALVPEHP